jgi:hypothetical protein
MKKTISLMLVLVVCTVAKGDFTFGTPTNLGPTINSSGYDWSPSVRADGLEMYFESDRPGGEGTYDIWVSTRASKEDDWGAPTNLGAPINTPDWQNEPCISADGLELYWNDWGLWVVRRATVSDPWGEPEKDSLVNINTSKADSTPCLSSDGLSLFLFSRNDLNLYVSTRPTRDDLWSEPVNLGPTVNGVNSAWENRNPSISADGLLLFFSSIRPGVSGGTDLWMTRRSTIDGPWSEPVNLGPKINSAWWEYQPEISADGRSLLFCSNRDDGHGHHDIWQVSIDPVVDLNDDGIVDAQDMSILIDHWHTSDPLCDIGPTPMGDGIVDFQDMIVLSEYLEPGFGRIAHWKLDETEGIVAHDSVGSYDADVLGDAVWQPDAGKVAGALAFDGLDDSIEPPLVLNPQDGPFRITAWVKGGAPGQVVAAHAPNESSPAYTYLAAHPLDGTLMTEMVIPQLPLTSDVVITDDQWHQVGVEWDGKYRHLYVNDIEVAVDEMPLPALVHTGWLDIGKGSGDQAGTFWLGLIDDVRVYRRGNP